MKTYFAVERQRGPSWREGFSMREQAQWDEHAVFMNGLAARGRVVLGGPVGTDGEILLIMDARTEQEARALLDDDPWTSLGLLAVSRVREWAILLEPAESS